jgi:hypothetical protein
MKFTIDQENTTAVCLSGNTFILVVAAIFFIDFFCLSQGSPVAKPRSACVPGWITLAGAVYCP